MHKTAKFLKANEEENIAKHIFEHEYKPQMLNSLDKEFQALQVKLSKEMLPWIEKRFDDYNVQRYVERYSAEERESIKQDIQKLTHRLILDAVGNLKKFR